MTPDEQKRILLLAEQVAGIDPVLGYRLAHYAGATHNEARATLSPICFHLMLRIGQTPPEECVCGAGDVAAEPWADAEPPARPKPEPKAEALPEPAITFADEPIPPARPGRPERQRAGGDTERLYRSDAYRSVARQLDVGHPGDGSPPRGVWLSDSERRVVCSLVTGDTVTVSDAAANGSGVRIQRIAADPKVGRPRDTYSIVSSGGDFWRDSAGGRRWWLTFAKARAAAVLGSTDDL